MFSSEHQDLQKIFFGDIVFDDAFRKNFKIKMMLKKILILKMPRYIRFIKISMMSCILHHSHVCMYVCIRMCVCTYVCIYTERERKREREKERERHMHAYVYKYIHTGREPPEGLFKLSIAHSDLRLAENCTHFFQGGVAGVLRVARLHLCVCACVYVCMCVCVIENSVLRLAENCTHFFQGGVAGVLRVAQLHLCVCACVHVCMCACVCVPHT